MTQQWHCYFHNGPCKLLQSKNGIQLEQHDNGVFRWWEIWNSLTYKTLTFPKKRDALKTFKELTK